ncbi:lipoprotein insertase outer membrane protein LolB [Lysobacter sp. LF1]|uniref:Outer-membrane lipoprotein LolB n=1 Tax=Lysobacter stagni TaxID=3045172 RepID=A0ABT6XFT0_9GAMM|nr:lipoprotein insertase outer membrane protein LolB [Lysobacter sp. LF1]MDI9238997.1 lipoprotein insertase outer membrane protein LolB [Lysobacter sp. LF1]
MRAIRAFMASACVALLLAGCVSHTVRTPAVPVDHAQAQAQDARRAEVVDWSLSGRIAVSNGKQGGSGRIDWENRAERYAVSLSAPVTRQSWRLAGDAAHARLEGIQGGPRESDDVEEMLRETTGWDIPVRAMTYWVRGVGAASDEFGPARVVYGEGNRPVRLEQAGWVIDFEQWQGAGEPAMPTRLVATRSGAKVRLIVDEWSLDAPR